VSQRMMNGRALRRLLMSHRSVVCWTRHASVVIRVPLSVLPDPPAWAPPPRWGAVALFNTAENGPRLERLRDMAMIDFPAANEYAAWLKRYTAMWHSDPQNIGVNENPAEPACAIREVYAAGDKDPYTWVHENRWCIHLQVYWPWTTALHRAVRALRDLQLVASRYGFSLRIGGPSKCIDPDWTFDGATLPESGFVTVRGDAE